MTPEMVPVLQKCLDAAASEIDHHIDRRYAETAAGSWAFTDSTAAADPGTGALGLDKQSPSAVTALYISNTDADGVDRSSDIAALDVSCFVRLTDPVDWRSWELFTVTGAPVAHAGWTEVPVNHNASTGSLPLDDGDALKVGAVTPTREITQGLALANRVNVLRGVEWWKANDAAFGIIGFDQVGAVRAPRDSFARHGATLVPLKQQWGIA